MAVPPLAHDPAATPVAVVFGGPSAEHDVSIVSGTAIADALVASGYPVEAWLIDLDGGWWRLPDGHRRDGRPQAAYDDPAGLGADGPVGAAAALDRLAAAERPPVVFLALHGPFGEDGTVQALCEAAGLAYTGSGVTASAVGMDKAVFKRLVRGLGIPVVDWREVRAARWARDPDGVLAELEAFAAGTGDARLMVKPARLGSVGRDDPRARGRGAGRGPRHRLPLRRPGAGRALPRRRAGPRGRRDRQRARRARAVRPGRDRRRATSSTTTRRSTPPGCPRRRPARRSAASSGRRSSSSRATRTGRRAARDSRAWTSCSPAPSWSSRRSTRSRASRRSACSRPCRPPRATTSPPSAGAWSISRWIAAASRVRRRLSAADLPR